MWICVYMCIGLYEYVACLLHVFTDESTKQHHKSSHNVTDLIKALLGNGSVNTPQRVTIEGKLCFLCGLRQTAIEQRGFTIPF
jgi:hypothetical protein